MNKINAAGIITMSDVKAYFTGNDWPVVEIKGNKFHAESVWDFIVDFEKSKKKYLVEIYSTEDSLDSDTIHTSDPVKSINEFLSRGMSNSDWMKAASGPKELAKVLAKLSHSIDRSSNVDPVKLKKIIRRISYVVKFGNDSPGSMDDLSKKLKKENWKVQETDDGLKVDIGDGLYEAIIKEDTVEWKYEIRLDGDESLTVEGITSDPIDEYKKWIESPDLARVYKERKKQREEEEERLMHDSDYAESRETIQ